MSLELRCPLCKKLLMFITGHEESTLHLVCFRCRHVFSVDHGRLITIAAPKRMVKQEILKSKRSPITTEDMVQMMEVRWRAFAKERAQRSSLIAPKRRFSILVRDNFTCQYCGLGTIHGAVLEVDHVTPKSQGGTDEEDNLITSCWECNRGKSDRLLTNLFRPV